MQFAKNAGQSAANGAKSATNKYEGKDGKFYESAMIAQLSDDGLAKNGKIDATKLTITALCNSVFKNDNSARAFLDTVDIAVNDVTQRATEIGSYMNRVDSAVESLGVQADNLTEAKSLIKDADIAKVSSEYISQQILQQAGATMLTTANQVPSIALNLI